MRTQVRVVWRAGVAVAFAATAALAVILSRGGAVPADLTSAGAAQAGIGTIASPQCTTSRLQIRLGAGEYHGTGYIRYPLEFTNVSRSTCTLTGYPRVFAYHASSRAAEGRQIGNAAGWDPSETVRRILLVPGATAHSESQLASVTDFPATRCRPVAAQELRVFPPGQSVAGYIPYTFAACSATGPRAPVFLNVQAIQKGTGAPSRVGV
jgi:Protein of unknown function (DUF4232)